MVASREDKVFVARGVVDDRGVTHVDIACRDEWVSIRCSSERMGELKRYALLPGRGFGVANTSVASVASDERMEKNFMTSDEELEGLVRSRAAPRRRGVWGEPRWSGTQPDNA